MTEMTKPQIQNLIDLEQDHSFLTSHFDLILDKNVQSKLNVDYKELILMIRQFDDETLFRCAEVINYLVDKRKIKNEIKPIETLIGSASISKKKPTENSNEALRYAAFSTEMPAGDPDKIKSEYSTGPEAENVAENRAFAKNIDSLDSEKTNSQVNANSTENTTPFSDQPAQIENSPKETKLAWTESLSKKKKRCSSTGSTRTRMRWTFEETCVLIEGLNLYGVGHWNAISNMPEMNRSNVQVKDRYITLIKGGYIQFVDNKFTICDSAKYLNYCG